jgi:hypothetical protein
MATDVSNTDVHERIRSRAYLLWVEEGRPEGRAHEHWLRAEAEVTGVNAADEAPPGTSGAGEHVCPACAGTGRSGRSRCKKCGGTGRIIEMPEP